MTELYVSFKTVFFSKTDILSLRILAQKTRYSKPENFMIFDNFGIGFQFKQPSEK